MLPDLGKILFYNVTIGVLYGAFLGVILILLLLSLYKSKNEKIFQKKLGLADIKIILNVIFILCMGMLVFVSFTNQILRISSICALVVTSFVPGYIFMELTQFSKKLGITEQILFGWVGSMIFSGIYFYVGHIIMKLHIWADVIYLGVLFVALVSIFDYNSLVLHFRVYFGKQKRMKNLMKSKSVPIEKRNQTQRLSHSQLHPQPHPQNSTIPETISVNISGQQLLNGIAIFSFIALNFTVMYPEFFTIIKTDMARHYSNVQILLQAPERLDEFFYWNFYFQQAQYVSLAGAQYRSNLTGLLSMTVLFPVAILYLIRKLWEQGTVKHSSNKNNKNNKNRTKIEKMQFFTIITYIILFPSFGSGSWLFVLIEKAKYPFLDAFQIYAKVAKFTNHSMYYSYQGLWFIPLVAALTAFFFLLGIIKNHRLSRFEAIVIETITIFFMYSIHVAEGTLMVAFIALLYLLKDNFPNFRLKEAWWGGLAGSILGLGYILLIKGMNSFPLYEVSLVTLLAYVIPLGLLIITYGLYYFGKRILNSPFIRKNFPAFRKVNDSDFDQTSIHKIRKPQHLLNESTNQYEEKPPESANTVENQVQTNQFNNNLIINGKKGFIWLLLISSLIFFIAGAICKIKDYNHDLTVRNWFDAINWIDYSLFGLNAVLFIIGLGILLKKQKIPKPAEFGIVFTVFFFTLGKVLTLINAWFNFRTNYYEKRIVILTIFGMSIIIAYFFITLPKMKLWLLNQRRKIHEQKRRQKKQKGRSSDRFSKKISKRWLRGGIILECVILVLIVITNTLILPIHLSYWDMYGENDDVAASWAEIDQLDAVKEMLDNDPEAIIVFLSRRSYDLMAIKGPVNRMIYMRDFPTSEQLINTITKGENISHPYVYVANRDLEQLNQMPNLQTLLSISPIAFQTEQSPFVYLYNLSKIGVPQANEPFKIASFDYQDLLNNPSSLGSAWAAYSQRNYSQIRYHPTQFNADILALNEDLYYPTLSLDETSPLDWNLYSGNWVSKYESGTFASQNPQFNFGSANVLDGGILYSIHDYHRLNVSIRLNVNAIDPRVSNYFKIIYNISRSNIINNLRGRDFNQVGLHLNKENKLYLQIDDEWPGIDLNQTWIDRTGENFIMNFDYNGTHLKFRYDNQTIMDREISEIHHIGLEYNRILNGTVEIIQWEGMRKNYQFDRAEYLDYVKTGGHLMVLNSNDQGLLFDRIINNTQQRNQIETNSVKILDRTYNVSRMNFNLFNFTEKAIGNSSIETLLYYQISIEPEIEEIPLVIRETFGQGQIDYINIFPIVQYLETHTHHNFPLAPQIELIYDELGF